MPRLLLVIASFGLTIFCWGIYGPVLHHGQTQMALGSDIAKALWRPFLCVGMAYFGIGVIAPVAVLQLMGEKGQWTTRGVIWSFGAGLAGALGALGILLAFNFNGRPVYVMPLVFGGAPVVNAFLTMYFLKAKRLNPVFLAGLIMVLLGAMLVLTMRPSPGGGADEVAVSATDFIWQVGAIALTIVCWGAYGPVLHRGQAAMEQSRLRPLICVGLAYFVGAVLASQLILSIQGEASAYNFKGTMWSLAAGAAGAVGALGIIMAFNFGGKPIYVMPLVFGGAPVVNTLWTIVEKDLGGKLSPFFLAGMILVIAGAAMVLVFAPKSPPPKKEAKKPAKSSPKPEEQKGVGEAKA